MTDVEGEQMFDSIINANFTHVILENYFKFRLQKEIKKDISKSLIARDILYNDY